MARMNIGRCARIQLSIIHIDVEIGQIRPDRSDALDPLEGQVEMPTCDILEPDDLRDGLILGCQARPVSSQLRIEF